MVRPSRTEASHQAEMGGVRVPGVNVQGKSGRAERQPELPGSRSACGAFRSGGTDSSSL